ncbi:unnamed protein product [Parnassius apollo]|uniref:(apollo) hypothetical protein n=1 Tax=Parnassius apollo TaxID=110799 RepID=A0A8S3Y4M8_PARAO|nr:unnamed protein product [Parnassius apollo]
MARRIALLLIVTVASCMEMRETVERMVMVRTTGSDLQPAATGYIYKKQSDGLASVTKMDEGEILKQLSKFYDQPKSFAAPIKAPGPFHSDEADDIKAASHSSESYVIPVEVKQKEDDHLLDEIANEDYKKSYGTYKKDFTDYLHGLGHFEDGIYHEHGGGEHYGSDGHYKYGDKEYKGYGTKNHYGKGDVGDYHTEKYESFYVSGKSGHKKDYDEADNHGKNYAEGHEEKGGDHGHKEAHSKAEKVEGFHKVFDKNEFKKDHDFYDGEGHKGGFHKFDDGYEYNESNDSKHKKGSSHDSAKHESESGKEGQHEKDSSDAHDTAHSDEEGELSDHHEHKYFGSKIGSYEGKGSGYEVKH